MKLRSGKDSIFKELSDQVKAAHSEIQICHLGKWDPALTAGAIAVDETLEPEQVLAEVRKKNINHLVQKNAGLFDQDLLMAGRLVASGSDYFQSEYVIFVQEKKSSLHLKFAGPEDKEDLKDRALHFVDKTKSGAVSQAAETIIEELYMNAVIDAPREALKKNQTLSEEKCEMFLALGEKYLQISCSDPYGSLDIAKLLSRMNEVYVLGAGEVINLTHPGGAGLGCVLLFENSSSLFLGVQPGKITKVTCLVALGMSNRQRAQMKKSLHWFQL